MDRNHKVFTWLLKGFLVYFFSLSYLAQHATADRFRVQGGWTEIRKGWPVGEKDYFVATNKGHHYIEVKLPPKLNSDLRVALDYYYHYSRVKPVIQMVPCDKNVDLHENLKTGDGNGKWWRHESDVKRFNCEKRNELAYNVLLHDPGDVFAWKVMEIQSEESFNTDHPEGASENSSKDASSQAPDGSGSSKSVDNSSSSPAKDSSGSNIKADNTSNSPAKDSSGSNTNDAIPGPPSKESLPQSDPKEKPSNTETNVISKPITKPPELNPVDKILERFGRDTTRPELKRFSLVCRPSSCNRDVFKMTDFTPLINGLPENFPQNLRTDSKLYLNTRNQPIKFKFEASSEQLGDVDSCVNFLLYMDKDTELAFMIEEPRSSAPGAGSSGLSTVENPTNRLLEKIKKSPNDYTGGRWDSFTRCISDYMPHFDQKDSADNTMSLIMQPLKATPQKQIALLIDPKKAFSFHELHPSRNFLPDIKGFTDVPIFNRHWVLDRDGIHKPTLSFEKRAQSNATSSSSAQLAKKQVLHISHIDSSQDVFDITSRWLKVRDAELIEHPILFIYRADKAHWIKRVDFEFQRAGQPLDSWISQTIYNTESSSTSNDKSNQDSSLAAKNNLNNEINFPIRLRGIDSQEFRLRIRHYLKSSPTVSDRELFIHSLSFADACADRKYCQNNGECHPIGTAIADCSCLQGYSGPYCELVKPCEVRYGEHTGSELCHLLGGDCVDTLPVMRCSWPNDQYYECKALFKPPLNYNYTGYHPTVPPQPSGSSEGDVENLPTSEQLVKLKDTVNNQAKLIIILGVFMAAILLFALVLIGSMVGRLQKSKRRLEQTRNEAHELSRRAQPSFSGQTSTGRAGKSHVASYNNSAFDVD